MILNWKIRANTWLGTFRDKICNFLIIYKLPQVLPRLSELNHGFDKMNHRGTKLIDLNTVCIGSKTDKTTDNLTDYIMTSHFYCLDNKLIIPKIWSENLRIQNFEPKFCKLTSNFFRVDVILANEIS